MSEASQQHDISNSDFDVNILDNVFSKPSIELTYPLPTDQDTYVKLDGNAKVINSFNLLHSAVKFFTGIPVEDIYSKAEYQYSIHKHHDDFHKKFENYMNNKLEREDKLLDELIYQLVNQELNLNLIDGKDFHKRFGEVKKFMVEYYKQENKTRLPTFKSIEFMRTAYLTVMTLFKKMFPKGIWCSRKDFTDLYHKYVKDPQSIVFLPSHQSHIDYIILHLICVRFNLATPAVVAGENLNVAVFGTFLKNLGAIFIKRSFNNELYTERNLNNVIEFLLLNKINFEVFIEGTRSRDGKLLLPKYGILKTLTNIYLKQKYDEKNQDFDLIFQPVSLTYERVYETDGYLKELVGSDKQQESGLNILQNGISNLLANSEEARKVVWGNDNFNDNFSKLLNGKIFFKLGNNFLLSDFINQESDPKFLSHLKTNTNFQITDSNHVNLKKLGFKILHEVNRISYVPEVSIVGLSLQIYYYFHYCDINSSSTHSKPISIKIKDLIPIFRLVSLVLYNENLTSKSITNITLLENLIQLQDHQVVEVFRDQVLQFFKYIQVHKTNDVIKILNPIELLYYKNLSIHLIIQRCIVSFIILYLGKSGSNSLNYVYITKLFYIIMGFLKTEFLFDYNTNKRNDLTFILNDFKSLNLIADGDNDGEYVIKDETNLNIFSNLIIPFLESYNLLIENIIALTNEKTSKLPSVIPHDVDGDDLKYPDTKGLLKYIITKHQNKENNTFSHIYSLESINKQYLVNNLYYIFNLQLISIFKNKQKTKAYVKILNSRDLNILNQFLLQLLNKREGQTSDVNLINNEVNLNYVIDIIDKRFNRDVYELQTKL
ncbi:glycerol-3-phosphate acyltransferase [Scheffersomyces coipomensis]|uniref:glycerol-3-phosphate acyltransferase n=1 Tax=Scheffersomyces coipomensis TaxID=1788519 RepID=UPI00315CA2B3